jgi:hypothetical protein
MSHSTNLFLLFATKIPEDTSALLVVSANFSKPEPYTKQSFEVKHELSPLIIYLQYITYTEYDNSRFL